ncbi:MAG: DUF4430 domain-containing protein [Candidatus Micrarchaeota archaeon]
MDFRMTVIVAAISLLAMGCVSQQAASVSPSAQLQMVRLTLAINDNNSVQTFNISVENGTTLFDILNLTEKIEYKDYGAMGMLVTSINGTAQNEGGNAKYWQFYVGGKLGEVGVSAYRIERPQSIEFRYETIDPGLS